MIAYLIIMFAIAVLFLAFGIAVYKGNTKLIHDYHRPNIKESERQEYGKAFSKGMFALSITLFISSIISLFVKESLRNITAVYSGSTIGFIQSIENQPFVGTEPIFH